MMKASEMREMDREAQEAELLKLRREQFNLRMQKATGQDMPQQDYRRVRKDIARLKTVMTESAANAAAKGA
ncbi:MAG: 50S ribosomal protein L29 [Pseudomonadota bacterium]